MAIVPPLSQASMTGGAGNLNSPVTPALSNAPQSSTVGQAASSTPSAGSGTGGFITGDPNLGGAGTASQSGGFTTSNPNLDGVGTPSQSGGFITSNPNLDGDGSPVAPSSQVNTPAGASTGTSGSAATSTTGSGSTGNAATSTPGDANVAAYASLSSALIGQTLPNSLNAYYNPTYHFRLFVAGDGDILEQANNSKANITNGSVKQVTIAESGVTGVCIKEVRMHTTTSQTDGSKNQSATTFIVTIIDPLGMTFLDGLAAATNAVNMRNYTKGTYFIELTFKGYDEAGNALIPSNLPNGGVWIWAANIAVMDIKINEGGGIFTLPMFAVGSSSSMTFNSNDEQRIPNQALTVSGSTVAQIFQDLATKVNGAWKTNAGGPMVQINIVTNKIAIGPPSALNVDPGTFTLKPVSSFQSAQRSWDFTGNDSGNVTCQIPPNATISECMVAIVQSTEQAQQLIKGVTPTTQVDISVSQTTPTGYRESVVFSVEADVMTTGFDTNSNNYIKQATFHLVAHSSLNVVASQTQIAQASTPAVQSGIVQNLLGKQLICKRYDYIYTGLNTELLTFNIEYDFSWNAILPRLAGANAGYYNAAVNGTLNPGNIKPQGTRYQATPQLDVTPDNSETLPTSAPAAGGSTVVPPSSTSTPQNMTTPSASSNPISTATPSLPGLAQTTTSPPGVASTPQLTNPVNPLSQVSGGTGNIYIEDITDALFIPQVVPLSFKYGNTNISQESGKSVSAGQFHRDQSVTGMIFAQLYGGDNLVGGKIQQIELEIRGDPFWLGQTNIDRVLGLRNNAPTFTPGVLDGVSAKFIVFIHFQYPLTVGDDFVPVLTASETFNGLYEVNEIDHVFVDGGFKQTLKTSRFTLVTPDMGNAITPPTASLGSGGTSPAAPAQTASNSGQSAAIPTPFTPVNTSGANTNTPITVDDSTA